MRLFFILALTLTAAAQTPTPRLLAPQQSITVTADRGLTDLNDAATSTALLNQQQLQQAPGLSLDDRLHQIAGFTLFRRTSSWTANPTTEGVSLRGLGSTAASRTLVVSDEVPQNDPFGGWIHWNEIPTLAIANVHLLLGGASDLYGSSAIGGVIDILPATPLPDTKFHFVADASGATQNSGLEDALLTTTTHYGSALAAISGFQTGGYIPTAPASRGLIDIPANVNGESARLELRTPTDQYHPTFFLRGNLLNEARSNGTPDQTNATRLWRYQSGADFADLHNTASLRLFGSRESYRQSFSSIPLNRNSETLTRLQRAPDDELGLALLASHRFAPTLIAAAGLDVRDIRATDNETTVATQVTTSTSARQRFIGGFLDAAWQPTHWTLSASIRVDSFRTFAARQVASNSALITPLPETDELVASPHLGLVRYFGKSSGLTATAFRAFRGPTMNELYRTGQVGQQTTLANASLLAERATGFEFGGFLNTRLGTLTSTWFWTEVNRAISAVLLTQTSSSQTLQRQNLGQIRSRGLSLKAQTNTFRNANLTLNYQLAFATVTAFNSSSPAQADLTGKWIPQVPRQSVTAIANYAAPHVAVFHLITSYTGQQFDDAANQYALHPYARFDLSADRALTRHLTLFASSQNLLNRTIQTGFTPTPTIAAPRLVQAGLRFTH